jgi:TDG/mug DNA glycosylase family protein
VSVLPDLLASDLDIVFCGTAASAASARRQAYYAGPGNAFWPTLHRVGLTPRRFQPEEYPLLLSLGMGLTDLVKTAAGSDASLAHEQFDPARLRRRIARYRPRIVAFTSKRAAHAFLGHTVDYGLVPVTLRTTRLYVLPSPSGLARRSWSLTPWRQLARLAGR